MKNRKGTLICFTGIDGSGKTTQAQALTETMKERGIMSQYVWVKFTPRITEHMMRILKRLLFRKKDEFTDYSGYLDARRRLFKNRLLFTFYHCLMLVDYYLQILLRIRVPLMKGKVVVCDRYIYDTVVDIAYDSDYSPEKIKKTLKLYLRLFPKPDVVFLIDLPEEIAYQRKNDIPSLYYLSERRKIYLDMGREHDMIILDGTEDESELKSVIESKVAMT